MSAKPIVISHQKTWTQQFEAESKPIRSALQLVRVHHIGSTSIPDIYAKPIIDMLGETSDLELIDSLSGEISSLGYEVLGEFGIAGRRYFRKDVEGVRKYHLHVFIEDSEEAQRHMRFRDYLIAHPEKAREYSDLKRRLSEESAGDMDFYIDGKEEFIREIDRQAAEWVMGDG